MKAARPRRPVPEQLSRREREIMHAVFALANRASAEDIRVRLVDPPSYSAVRAMLVRLEAKGHLRHTEEAGRYIYQATTSPASAKRAALSIISASSSKGRAISYSPRCCGKSHGPTRNSIN